MGKKYQYPTKRDKIKGYVSPKQKENKRQGIT